MEIVKVKYIKYFISFVKFEIDFFGEKLLVKNI